MEPEKKTSRDKSRQSSSHGVNLSGPFEATEATILVSSPLSLPRGDNKVPQDGLPLGDWECKPLSRFMWALLCMREWEITPDKADLSSFVKLKKKLSCILYSAGPDPATTEELGHCYSTLYRQLMHLMFTQWLLGSEGIRSSLSAFKVNDLPFPVWLLKHSKMDKEWDGVLDCLMELSDAIARADTSEEH